METNSLQKYHLKNTNLTQSEKVIIECLYLVPININEQIFILLLIFLGIQDWFTSYLIAGVFGILLAFLSEKSMAKQNYSIFTKLGIIFAGYGSMILNFSLSGIAYYLTENLIVTIIPLLSAFGLTSMLTPAIFTLIILNRGNNNQRKNKLHFKYVMANKIWGKNF